MSQVDLWSSLLDVIILLLTALVLGAICERFRQSAILGYLLAGTLLGPHALNWISNEKEMEALAELGVTLLLFTIGLEFSWGRLRRLGTTALGGGTLQVIITLGVATCAAVVMGLALRPAIVIGAVIALSSTAGVLRVLVARAEIESVHGRHALGILLVQDLAVVPLVVLVSVTSGEGTVGQMVGKIMLMVLLAAALFSSFYLLSNYVVPPVLGTRMMQHNRELPILLAVVLGFGSAWAANELKLPAAFGAFVAGMLLGESPFATQIRADISSLRTVLLTLFFSSIGMLGDPLWVAQHLPAVVALVMAIVVGKVIIVWLVLKLLHQTHTNAIAAGLCLAQVGEFSFVLAAVARVHHLSDGTVTGVITDDMFKLIVSATIVTLFLTPYLVTTAWPLSQRIVALLERFHLVSSTADTPANPTLVPANHIVIIGFGPAGRAVGETLTDRNVLVRVVDLNLRAISTARQLGFNAHVGDARKPEVLEQVSVPTASVVVITVPDPTTVRSIVEQVRALAPQAHIIARARYHIFHWELKLAGAHVVIDEEQQVGERLAQELQIHLRDSED